MDCGRDDKGRDLARERAGKGEGEHQLDSPFSWSKKSQNVLESEECKVKGTEGDNE